MSHKDREPSTRYFLNPLEVRISEIHWSPLKEYLAVHTNISIGISAAVAPRQYSGPSPGADQKILNRSGGAGF